MRARWALGIATAIGLVFTGGAAALAVDPVTLSSSSVLDDAGVLSSAQLAEAEGRLQRLSDETPVDLWVVFVDRFTNPTDAGQWAADVADANGPGPNQYLLAVSTTGRQYYLSSDSAGPLTEDQISTIEQQLVQPVLRAGDWVGAVDAATTGLDEKAGLAVQSAQNDVGAFAGGGMTGRATDPGGGMLGAVLGGIVITSLLGGGRSSGGLGGMLGGGGGMRPGSFGGGGTRARRGGGRF